MSIVPNAVGQATGSDAGRPGLILDAADYGRAVLLQGARIDWDPAAHLRFLGQIGALLKPDYTLIDLGALVDDEIGRRPDLITAMGARSRTGYALRTLLADDRIGERAVDLLRVAAGSSPLPIAVQLPSPEVWLCETAELAGAEHDADDDDRENASVYFADWLRRFADVDLGPVLLDGRRARNAEALSLYDPVIRLAEHYRWHLFLWQADGVQAVEGTAAELPGEFWLGEDVPVPDAALLVSSLPANANPEQVLQRRTKIEA